MGEFSETARKPQRRSGTIMRGAPAGGAVGSLVPDEPTTLCPVLLPMLPVVEGPPELDPTVPVTGAGIPAVPTPVPKFGVTVVLPGPVPPGTPTPEDGVWAGVPGCPGPEDAVPGDVAPAAPPDVPPPAPLCASAAGVRVTSNVAASNEVRTGMDSSCKRIVAGQRPRRQVRSEHGAAESRGSASDCAALPNASIRLVRSRGLEPPRVAPLAPQASASTNSATTACEEECRSARRLATRM